MIVFTILFYTDEGDGQLLVAVRLVLALHGEAHFLGHEVLEHPASEENMSSIYEWKNVCRRGIHSPSEHHGKPRTLSARAKAPIPSRSGVLGALEDLEWTIKVRH